MAIYQLRAAKRNPEKTSTKKLRIKGEIPAIYYRKDAPSIPIQVSAKDLDQLLNAPKGLVRLNVGDKESFLAVAKEVQWEPVSHRPLHMTFEGVKEGELFHINLQVKLEYSEDCEWMKNKGVAMLKMNHLHVEVLPRKMPDAVHIDISHLKVGDTLQVGDLKIPDLKFLDNPHTEVVSIIFRSVSSNEEEEKEKSSETAAEVSSKASTGSKESKESKE